MAKAGRNDPCPCGSGKKFKNCCAVQPRASRGSKLMMALLLAALAGGIYAAIVSFTDEGSPVAAPGKVWSAEHGHYH